MLVIPQYPIDSNSREATATPSVFLECDSNPPPFPSYTIPFLILQKLHSRLTQEATCLIQPPFFVSYSYACTVHVFSCWRQVSLLYSITHVPLRIFQSLAAREILLVYACVYAYEYVFVFLYVGTLPIQEFLNAQKI